MFFVLGFIFEEDCKLINIQIENSGEISINNDNYKDLEDFDYLHYANINQNNHNNKPFASINEVYLFSQSLTHIAISNAKILNNFNNFKIACAVIAYTREILCERNHYAKTNKDQENRLELENNYSDAKNEEVKKDLNSSNFLNEEKQKFKWSEDLKILYSIAFEEFLPQFEIVKR